MALTNLANNDIIPEAWVDGVVDGLSSVCNGRLTLTSGTAVTTSDVTAAGTLYFTPFRGNNVGLFNGTTWSVHEFTERSLALTLTAANVYDIFLYDNAGTLTLESLVWTNATTRATALVLQDGILCKSGALTRRYLGTIYASGTNTTEDSITKRYVWNYYNRVTREMYAQETTVSWTYTTANVWRATNNSSVERLQFVIGVAEDLLHAHTTMYFHANPGTSVPMSGIGYDSATASYRGATGWAVGNTYNGGVSATFKRVPDVGFHYLQALESCRVGGGTITWYGSSGVGESAAIQGAVIA